jgi:hypothetical protein
MQVPINILDQRWNDLGLAKKFAARPDITVHARSIFLQGVLLQDDPAGWPPQGRQQALALIDWLRLRRSPRPGGAVRMPAPRHQGTQRDVDHRFQQSRIRRLRLSGPRHCGNATLRNGAACRRDRRKIIEFGERPANNRIDVGYSLELCGSVRRPH